MKRSIVWSFALALAILSSASLLSAGSSNRKEEGSSTTAVSIANADTMRALGEQRFRENCGRCHAAPQKFPPRAMSTVLRHMRVRATITDEDMRLVLFYMTQ
jgi:mono/diheme cytochrome c family protein